MDRREFVRFLALISANATAMPEQIKAYETYFNANTPLKGKSFIGIDEIMISGLANCSSTVLFKLFREGESTLRLGLNAFGGICRWVPTPDMKIICAEGTVKWEFDLIDIEYKTKDEWIKSNLEGHISYVDSTEAVRHYVPINRSDRRL